MRTIVVFAVLIAMLVSSCIGQEEKANQWTVEEWKDYLFFANPNINQSISNMAAGLSNVQELAPGTHIVIEGGARGSSIRFYGAPLASYGMTLEMTVLDKEVVNGKECTVVELAMEIRTNIEGEPISIVLAGKEWVDAAGNPVKMDGEVKMALYEGFETSIKTNVEQVGEEQYKGHDCWVFSGTQSTGLMGINMDSETAQYRISMDSEIVQYMDKESYAVVGTLVDGEEQEINEEFEDAITYVTELEWELGDRKTITTELGTYDCQVIYLKKEGKKVGKLWVNEEFKAPLKYEITYEMKGMKLEMNVTLIEYVLGA